MRTKVALYKNIATGFVICILIAFTVMVLRPLPPASDENCSQYSGLVTSVDAGDNSDIIIRLQNDNTWYYINRGIDQGISPAMLKQKISGRNIELLAVEQWTPLDPASKSKHIARITVDGSVLYDEMK